MNLLLKQKILLAVLSVALILLIYHLMKNEKNFGFLVQKRIEILSQPSVDGSTKIVVLWTHFFGQSNYISPLKPENCPFLNCIFTSNRSLLTQSDAVIFHLRDFDSEDLPQYRHQKQRWIILNHESPQNTITRMDQLEGLVNWTITYRLESDILLSPQFTKKQDSTLFNPNKDYSANKTKMIVWLVSNCKTPSRREDFVEEMQKTVTIDVFGQCGDKTCLPKMSKKCFEKLSKEYRFILAFENSICKDYVTEKFFDALSYDFVPVVFGGADYSSLAPEGSFVDALSYESPRQLASYLIQLSKKPEQYNSYFKWKMNYQLVGKHYPCEICKKLNNPKEPTKVWTGLNKWWFKEAKCRSWIKPEIK